MNEENTDQLTAEDPQSATDYDLVFTPPDFSSTEFEINIPNFEGLNFDFENRYSRPQLMKEVPEELLLYEDAEQVARAIKIEKDQRQFFILNGSFIFGDLIEAMIINKGLFCEEMIISTLSMSENNIDSLGNLLLTGWVDRLDLILSDYWWAHERGNLVPYLLKELDQDNKLQVAVTRTHTKMCQFKTTSGLYYIIHGSANLRSSNNIEQITVEENKRLYFFMKNFHNALIERYKVINKSIRQDDAWKVIKEEYEKQQLLTGKT